MTCSIALVSLVVPDYDEAVSYYTSTLGFDLIEDSARESGKRWVVVAPRGGRGASLLLARAATEEQQRAIGNQTGGRVFLFLHTDDFWRDHRALLSRGVKFVETPREEPYGTVVVFEDLYGNKWDLVQHRPNV
jgi:catechol 2,3-dioxygenase-like lactoylglutathione lyase family enzyme